MSSVILVMNWNKDLLDVDHRTHDICVVSFKTWSRRSLSYGRAQTCRNQSNVRNSRQLLHVTLKFETKVFPSDTFAQVNLMSVAPMLQKIQDRSQEETEWQEQGAREAAWRLAKSVFKLKEHEKAAFFSSPENRCLPASTLKLEEREFVVDSGASMHMISKKDLSKAEMDNLTKSCSPTIVITANGEVQTHEEAIVYVKELDIFLTMKVLENTPAVNRSVSFAMKTDTNGSMVKNHISLRTGFGYNATRRTSFLLWFQACQRARLQDLTHQLRGHFRDRGVPSFLAECPFLVRGTNN